MRKPALPVFFASQSRVKSLIVQGLHHSGCPDNRPSREPVEKWETVNVSFAR